MDDLRLNATLNKSGFSQSLQQIRQEAKQAGAELSKDLSSSWGGIGKGIIGGIGGFLGFEAMKGHLEGLVSKGSELRELAEQFDTTTDSVQKWQKATERAGLSFTTFTRAMDTLRSKQQAAREDDKGLIPFRGLGISDSDARDLTKTESLMQRILTSGVGRGQIMELLGTRGARLGAAIPYLQGAQPSFTPDDITALHETEMEMGKAKSLAQRASLRAGPGALFIGASQIFTGEFQKGIENLENAASGGTLGVIRKWVNKLFGNTAKAVTAAVEAKADEPDPSYVHKLMDESKQYSERVQTGTDRIEEIRRRGMTSGQRRDSIRKELSTVRALMRKESDAKNTDPLVTEGEFIQRKNLRLLDLGAKESELSESLKERPLATLSGGHSRVGLFSRGAIAGAGFGSEGATLRAQLMVQREMNAHLRRIANTDVHHP